MFKQYPLVELVCENDLVYSEWLNRFDEILRELHGKDKVTVDLAFAIFRKIQEVYGFLEYEGEVDLTMKSKYVLDKILARKDFNIKHFNVVLTRIDQQLGRRGLYSRFKKMG